MKALVQGTVIAESKDTKVVEGNHYFQPESIHKEFFLDSSLHTHCAWKGQASYYHIEVAGKRLDDAAWYYPNPSKLAEQIKDHVAFYPMVTVTE